MKDNFLFKRKAERLAGYIILRHMGEPLQVHLNDVDKMIDCDEKLRNRIKEILKDCLTGVDNG